MYGQGSFYTTQNKSGGAPFPAGAANNGLSVDTVTGKIVLGTSAAGPGLSDLLNHRFIELNGFSVNFFDVTKQTTIFGSGFGTHVFTLSNLDGQVLAINGHNISTGTNAIQYMAMFNNAASGISLISTGTNYVGAFPGNAAILYNNRFGSPTQDMFFLSDPGGNFFFAPNGITVADSRVSMFVSGNSRFGDSGADNGATLQTSGTFNTGDPGFATGAGNWQFGNLVVAGAVLDATQYIEVAIAGTIYKLALIV